MKIFRFSTGWSLYEYVVAVRVCEQWSDDIFVPRRTRLHAFIAPRSMKPFPLSACVVNKGLLEVCNLVINGREDDALEAWFSLWLL